MWGKLGLFKSTCLSAQSKRLLHSFRIELGSLSLKVKEKIAQNAKILPLRTIGTYYYCLQEPIRHLKRTDKPMLLTFMCGYKYPKSVAVEPLYTSTVKLGQVVRWFNFLTTLTRDEPIKCQVPINRVWLYVQVNQVKATCTTIIKSWRCLLSTKSHRFYLDSTPRCKPSIFWGGGRGGGGGQSFKGKKSR